MYEPRRRVREQIITAQCLRLERRRAAARAALDNPVERPTLAGLAAVVRARPYELGHAA